MTHLRFGIYLLAQVAALSWIGGASAQIGEPELTHDVTDGEITIDANGATVRQILDRLFTESGTEVDWRDQASARKVIEGRFKGSLDQVTQRLLANENYIAISARSDGQTRIVRVIIIGQANVVPRMSVAAQADRPLPKLPGTLDASRIPKKKIWR
jgi:ABC-type nitrate/sulfonate/bicarbonate transport system substrate-binding protein